MTLAGLDPDIDDGFIDPPESTMNPLNQLSDVVKAVTFPFHVVFVVSLCYLVNWFTSPGHWWAQWVAFGMGIALLCVWARALKAIVTTVGLAGGAYLIYRWWQRRSASGVGHPVDPARF